MRFGGFRGLGFGAPFGLRVRVPVFRSSGCLGSFSI